ncbi:hypothetical protein N7466_001653 [Penicillium verhagenii]|uniref:uncharacterized protein n=1 Tax=Penicillium verhagenii TaxID=1562060 RepID=UPI002545BC89|nr:uncharacterized protein N7466_001653 [Penicillium verhagenii]KAJ5938519.1 hypothetical protein N7466_001653 [Penicillium verhagenii]
MATTGAFLNRALRSRLLQQRLNRSSVSQHLDLRTASRILRPYATTTAAQDEPYSNTDSEPSLASLAASQSTYPDNDNASGRKSRRHNISSRGSGNRELEELLMEIAQQSSPHVNPKHVRLEMEWVQDPLLLAQRVSTALKGGDPAMAVALAREATKQIPGTKFVVAWNRIFHWCFERGHPKAALRFFNDMKKRAGKPNPQTFTILLRGLKKSLKAPGFNIVRTAEAIYNSISAENSGVERDIIHTNAMLAVCQYQGDVDSLWRIAGSLPEQGPEAPDMTTYTTILGTLLFAHREKIKTMDASQIDRIFALKAQLVSDGKRIWADILYRWKNDNLPPDAQVVHSMSALLLEGASDHDYYDVLALYHQTMGIPIFAKQPPESTKNTPNSMWKTKQSRNQEPAVEEDVPFVDENNQKLKLDKDGTKEEESSFEEEQEENFDLLFDSLPEGPVPELQPGNQDLTLIQEACLNITQGSKAGYEYWNHLTLGSTPLRIKPDEVATTQFLRLLRVSRASNKALQAIRDQLAPSGNVSGKVLHIALSVCRRDKHNQSCLVHANALMDIMGESLLLPDPRALQGYLELVQSLSQQPNLLLYLRGLEIEERREGRTLLTLGKKLQVNLHLFALKTLRPHFTRLHEAMEHGKQSPKGRWDTGVREAVPGPLAVKTMARIRLMIDEVLKSEYSAFLSKADRKLLRSESIMLKKYSDKAIIEKFGEGFVFSTPEQRSTHHSRKNNAEACDTSKLDGQNPVEGLEPPSFQPTESKL